MNDGPPKKQFTFRAGLDERGGFHPDDARQVRARLARWAKRKVYVTVGLEPKRRSLTANNYLWLVYGFIADWSGHEAEEIHDAMKLMLLPKRLVTLPTGEEIETLGSTRLLDSHDFSEYVSKVKRWAAENGCYVPEPGEAECAL